MSNYKLWLYANLDHINVSRDTLTLGHLNKSLYTFTETILKVAVYSAGVASMVHKKRVHVLGVIGKYLGKSYRFFFIALKGNITCNFS